ncbi:hypothetical protein BN12_960001 [Nostocoides japonicum T1-X7]|uniref:Tetratricopeptide repeat protein n=1 Tax=Nostocoides japonicum T1-X7 TaxID=1194083 RepID=A0A077M8X0_9MICO|nr:hypothetical protein BN12_960001 [Tetrasphaera japonica T1-X7]
MLCTLLHDLGHPDAALDHGRQAVEGFDDLADRSPGFRRDLARSLMAVARVRLDHGEAARATKDAQRALALLEGLTAEQEAHITQAVTRRSHDLATAQSLVRQAREAAWGAAGP